MIVGYQGGPSVALSVASWVFLLSLESGYFYCSSVEQDALDPPPWFPPATRDEYLVQQKHTILVQDTKRLEGCLACQCNKTSPKFTRFTLPSTISRKEYPASDLGKRVIVGTVRGSPGITPQQKRIWVGRRAIDRLNLAVSKRSHLSHLLPYIMWHQL
jgi:hypothetical protein